jgi:hypothetical protein
MSVEAASIELLEESRVILANNVEELEKELRDADKRYEKEADGMRDEIKRLHAALARAHKEQAEMQISRDSCHVGALSPGSKTGEAMGSVGGSYVVSSPGLGDVSANARLSAMGEGRQRKEFAGDDRESLKIEVLRLEESSERLMEKLENALLLADQVPPPTSFFSSYRPLGVDEENFWRRELSVFLGHLVDHLFFPFSDTPFHPIQVDYTLSGGMPLHALYHIRSRTRIHSRGFPSTRV